VGGPFSFQRCRIQLQLGVPEVPPPEQLQSRRGEQHFASLSQTQACQPATHCGVDCPVMAAMLLLPTGAEVFACVVPQPLIVVTTRAAIAAMTSAFIACPFRGLGLG